MADRVPQDMWICHECNAENLIDTAPQQCPVCANHTRCSRCPGPGDARPQRTGMYSASDNGPNWAGFVEAEPIPAIPGSCFSSLQAESHRKPFLRRTTMNQHLGLVSVGTAYIAGNSGLSPFNQLTPEYPDAWTCPNCGASNSGLTPDFCPVCEWRA